MYADKTEIAILTGDELSVKSMTFSHVPDAFHFLLCVCA